MPAIRLAVRQLPGTGKVAGDHSGVVTVEYDPTAVGVERIRAALLGVGFESTVLVER